MILLKVIVITLFYKILRRKEAPFYHRQIRNTNRGSLIILFIFLTFVEKHNIKTMTWGTHCSPQTPDYKEKTINYKLYQERQERFMIVHVEMYFHALKNSAGACILSCIYPQSPALDCLRLPAIQGAPTRWRLPIAGSIYT